MHAYLVHAELVFETVLHSLRNIGIKLNTYFAISGFEYIDHAAFRLLRSVLHVADTGPSEYFEQLLSDERYMAPLSLGRFSEQVGRHLKVLHIVLVDILLHRYFVKSFLVTRHQHVPPEGVPLSFQVG
jgi:hypothetical protein